MDQTALLHKLETWQEDELLFKDYFLVTQGTLSMESFLSAHSADSANLNFALHPESLSYLRQENEFIPVDRNIALVKHPRYFPRFFHQHEFFEMIYILSGTCRHFLAEKQVFLSTGDFCLIAPGVSHAVEVTDDSLVLNILIRSTTFFDIFQNIFRSETQISHFFLSNLYARKKVRHLLFHTGSDTTLQTLILTMYQEELCFDEYSEQILCSLLSLFWSSLLRRHRKDFETADRQISSSFSEEALLSYLFSHYQEITLSSLADHFHFSQPYCSTLIKKITGSTFSELLTSIRLQTATTLLLTDTLNIEAVSEKIGYKNPETFIRAFKKEYGVTPAQYRKQNRRKIL